MAKVVIATRTVELIAFLRFRVKFINFRAKNKKKGWTASMKCAILKSAPIHLCVHIFWVDINNRRTAINPGVFVL